MLFRFLRREPGESRRSIQQGPDQVIDILEHREIARRLEGLHRPRPFLGTSDQEGPGIGVDERILIGGGGMNSRGIRGPNGLLGLLPKRCELRYWLPAETCQREWAGLRGVVPNPFNGLVEQLFQT